MTYQIRNVKSFATEKNQDYQRFTFCYHIFKPLFTLLLGTLTRSLTSSETKCKDETLFRKTLCDPYNPETR